MTIINIATKEMAGVATRHQGNPSSDEKNTVCECNCIRCKEEQEFDLKTLKEKNIPFLRRKLGIVFQDFKLLPDRTVNDNLLFVLKATGWKDKEQMQKNISEVLSKVGMKTKGFKYPHQLSGGEQQRVAIARALLNDPELILADEPTGNLDPQTSVEIMKVLQEINKSGRTILMATHDYALLLKFPSKTLKCDGSKVFEVVQRNV